MMAKEQLQDKPVVFVIDDDEAVRDSLRSLFRSVGLQVAVFDSTQAFLRSKRPNVPSCLVLDIRLPDVSGLDFQDKLAKEKINIPITFITGYGDIPMTVKALRAGAVGFLTKPLRDEELLDTVRIGLEQDRARRERDRTFAELRARFDSLTRREQQTFGLVTTGLMNKQIAAELGVSEITVKAHRGNVMRKMDARTFADLIRMADILGDKQPAVP
ncbi:MAG TPA: response regulator transcription factor [Pseudolabrys sp.]|jgi:FixJ family two-component response regulator